MKTTNENGRQHGGCNTEFTGMNPSMQIHPVILSWLADNWKIEIGNNQESINCYMEMKQSQGWPNVLCSSKLL
jgi:hypothetical protein